jgi:hypothetical protein
MRRLTLDVASRVAWTGQPQTKHTEMRYPTRASKLVHRRLQVPPSPLHDPSCIQLHACTPGEELPRALCLTWDIRAHYLGCRYPYDARRAVSLYIGAHEQRSRSAERRRRYWQARIPWQLAGGEAAARFRDRSHGTIPGRMWREIGNDFSVLNRPGEWRIAPTSPVCGRQGCQLDRDRCPSKRKPVA